MIIQQLSYLPPSHRESMVEVMTFERLRELNDGAAQRADFHVLAVVDDGAGSVSIDFRSRVLGPGSAVWIPAGSVHQWTDIVDLHGVITLFVPIAPAVVNVRDEVVSSSTGTSWLIPDAIVPLVRSCLEHLWTELRLVDDVGLPSMPPVLLSALLLRVQLPRTVAGGDDSLFLSFRALVERDFRTHRDADHYARALGYSARTLSRAAQRATGRTAKAYIVERTVLEAKRLLAYDELTAAQCASALSFADASNFSTFFRNATGCGPRRWRDETLARNSR